MNHKNCSKGAKMYIRIRAMAIMVLSCVLLSLFVPGVASAVEEDDAYDMQAVSNTFGTIFSLGYMPVDDGDDVGSILGVNVLRGCKRAGNAGLVLTYTSKPTSLGQWIASKMSASSMAYSYESLMNIRTKVLDGDGNANDNNGVITGEEGQFDSIVYRYAVYGRLLNELGLDDTTVAISGGGIVRKIAGSIMYILYIFASAISGIFSVVISLLKMLNPFGWLEYAKKNYGAELGSQYYSIYAGTGGWKNILRFIASVYSTMCNLSWVFIIPMGIALYLAKMFLFRKVSGGKRLLKRIIFTCIGVPLVGGLYTSFLNEMSDMLKDDGYGYPERIIARTFVDFEGWAKTSHLGIPMTLPEIDINEAVVDTDDSPDEASDYSKACLVAYVPVNYNGLAMSNTYSKRKSSLDPLGGTPSNETRFYLHNICSAINNSVYSGSLELTADKKFISDNVTTSGWQYTTTQDDGGGRSNDSFIEDSTTSIDVNKPPVNTATPAPTATPSPQQKQDSIHHDVVDGEMSSNKQMNTYIRSLLDRYKDGDVYSADLFASDIQARMSDLGNIDGTTLNFLHSMMRVYSLYTDLPGWEEDKGFFGTITSWFTENKGLSWDKKFDNSVGVNNVKITRYDYKLEAVHDDESVRNLVAEGSKYVNVSPFNDGGLKTIINKQTGGDRGDVEVGSNLYFHCVKANTSYARGSGGEWKRGSYRMGLSTMSMYNYLNCDFTYTGVTVYGGGNAITNGFVRGNHYSVNVIGTGAMSIIYYLEAAVLLGCTAFVGLLYGLGMFTGSIKYTLKVIMAMPMAVIGSMRYIAKFVGMVAAMIINILITALMYGVVCEIIIIIADIISNSYLLLTLAASLGIIAVICFSGIIEILLLIWITKIILKIRKSAVNSVTEWITQIVGKFFEADGHADPSKPHAGIGQKIAQGVAAGAGMAMGNNLAKGASSLLGGALSGGDGDGGGSDDGKSGGSSIGNDTGGGIEKEVKGNNSTHSKTEGGKTQGGQSTSERDTSSSGYSASFNGEDHSSLENNGNNVSGFIETNTDNNMNDHEGTESQTSDARTNSESARAAEQSKEHNAQSSASDREAKAAEQTTRNNAESKASERSARAAEQTNTHANKDRASAKETKGPAKDAFGAKGGANGTKGGMPNDAMAAKQIAGDLKEGVVKGKEDIQSAAENLKKGNIKDAAGDVKNLAKDTAKPAAEVAALAATGDVKTAAMAGNAVDKTMQAKQNIDDKKPEAQTKGVAGNNGDNPAAAQANRDGAQGVDQKAPQANRDGNQENGQKTPDTKGAEASADKRPSSPNSAESKQLGPTNNDVQSKSLSPAENTAKTSVPDGDNKESPSLDNNRGVAPSGDVTGVNPNENNVGENSARPVGADSSAAENNTRGVNTGETGGNDSGNASARPVRNEGQDDIRPLSGSQANGESHDQSGKKLNEQPQHEKQRDVQDSGGYGNAEQQHSVSNRNEQNEQGKSLNESLQHEKQRDVQGRNGHGDTGQPYNAPNGGGHEQGGKSLNELPHEKHQNVQGGSGHGSMRQQHNSAKPSGYKRLNNPVTADTTRTNKPQNGQIKQAKLSKQAKPAPKAPKGKPMKRSKKPKDLTPVK